MTIQEDMFVVMREMKEVRYLYKTSLLFIIVFKTSLLFIIVLRKVNIV